MITDKKRKGKTRSYNIWLPPGVRARAEAAARSDERSLTRWVVRACRDLLAAGQLPARIGAKGDDVLYLDLPTDLLAEIEADMADRRKYAAPAVATVTEFVRRAIVAAVAG